jgi:indolepyruvate ferredoxin oxidoreductase beta subunit
VPYGRDPVSQPDCGGKGVRAMTETCDFLLSGVGGQGTLLASNILAEVGLRAGYDVKKSEVHGMAQRGGSVSSHVRWGKSVHSPLIAIGEADMLVALERVEAVRYLEFLRSGGIALINDHVIIPVTVTTGDALYPSGEDILRTVRQVTPYTTMIPAVPIAKELGNVRAHNVVVLGVVSQHLDVSVSIWKQVVGERVPPRYVDLNLEAFSRGRNYV